jgi:hypothetical protein
VTPAKRLRHVLATVLSTLLLPCAAYAQEEPDLIIEVGPTVFEHGGVLTVYPIPTADKNWEKIGKSVSPPTVRLDERYGVVQFRYPRGAEYTFRVRPVEGIEGREAFLSQVLSIIGTDEKGNGPQMELGFTGEYSSGGQTIRSLPRNEYAGADESTRANARWGYTESLDDPPPADERGARSLIGVVELGARPLPLTCEGDLRAQVCTIPPERHAEMDALWWRSVAESRLERLQFYALRRCYDSTWSGDGFCHPDPDTDEPAFIHRSK